MANLLFIGANDMSEIANYFPKYNTNYTGCNRLVSDVEGKTYKFNVFSNQVASSSIYEANFQNVLSLQTEISTKPYYNGGVLFDTLNDYLQSKGFLLTSPPSHNPLRC